MTEQYYRSPIDKLVVESGMTATLIAQYMQIKYHRMVALRRLKDVQEQDIELCKQAIAKIIDDKIPFRRGNIPVDVKPKTWHVNTKSVIQARKMELSQQIRNLCYLLGQMQELTENIFCCINRNVDKNDEQITRLLKRRNSLIDYYDKIINFNQP
jgi:hypothetical protein